MRTQMQAQVKTVSKPEIAPPSPSFVQHQAVDTHKTGRNGSLTSEVLQTLKSSVNASSHVPAKLGLGHNFQQIGIIQPKLTEDQANGEYEHEVDVPQQDQHLSYGTPLDVGTKAFLEGRFGRRFDDVCVEKASGYLSGDALAAAQGNQITFTPLLNQVATSIRRAVVAHEAAHVLQWRRGQQTKSQPWSEQSLEAEANRAELATVDGRTPTIRGVARSNSILFHPIFISTFGSRKYLNTARDFYTRWGYGAPQSVSSIEEIVMQLAQEAGHLDRMTIVSHTVPDTINISFLRGGTGHVDRTDWALTTPEALPGYSAHSALDQEVHQIMREVRNEQANADMLARLEPDINEPRMHQFVWWLVDAGYLARVTPRNVIPNRPRVVERALQNAQTYKRALKAELREFAALGLDVREDDMDALEQAIRNVMRNRTYNDPIDRETGRLLAQQVLSGREAALRRILIEQPTAGTDSFWTSLMYTRLRFNASSTIEIKGCRIGQNLGYLEAISRFFAWPDQIGPIVTAPDMFQSFGYLGYKSHPDTTAYLRRLWNNRNIRDAFRYWAGIFGWHLSDPPVADDLIAALRAGNAFPVGTTLHFLAGNEPDTVTAWFSRFGYHLSSAPDIEEAFFINRTFAQAMKYTVVEWLQDRRPNGRPRQLIFPPDPQYQNHIRSARANPAENILLP